ncbi:glycosyltransferase family 2 protein [Algoriphagus terrigena]|uniref:glycosyltransferase family 2 protein n=1 Tax=Algoriphagus terrigena TaxID=344884 RepID=UPI0004099ABB|nr:glycosyltransferase family 2 protein [Algoriphagus terrigena]
MNSKSCIIIPYYKSGSLLIDVLDKVPEVIHYVIIVDDCSPIPLPEITSEKYRFELIVLKHSQNRGVGGAMKTGFQKALENKEIKFFFKVDSDDQMDLTQIPRMKKQLMENGADFVKGNRLYDIDIIKRMPVVRRMGNLLLSFITKFCTGYWNVQDPTNGFFGIKRRTLSKLKLRNLHDSYFFETSLLGELFLNGAYIKSIRMPPIYKTEVSNMNVALVPFEFLPKLFRILIKRISYKYFLFELNIGSIYLLGSGVFFVFGTIFGIYHYQKNFDMGITTPAGTVIIFALCILVSFNLFLSWLDFDTKNSPKRKKL